MCLPFCPLFVKNPVTTLFTPDRLALVDANLDTALSAKIMHGSRGSGCTGIGATTTGRRLVGFALIRHNCREVGGVLKVGCSCLFGFVV